ncbi:hypothetical protein BC832DRAFT_312806 [Gaertneriomyces semiglobifer]|nr:hypothetical protein BC832DRAFT_312806 [Gaertneriomyces semiglobifer]
MRWLQTFCGEVRCESRELETSTENNLDYLLTDSTGTGRRGTELSLGESLGRMGISTAEAARKLVRSATACRDVCLRKADETKSEYAECVKIPWFFHNHRIAVAFIMRPLFANIVVANYVGEFNNPFYANLVGEALQGVKLFLHARSVALATASLPKRLSAAKQTEGSVPTSAKKKTKLFITDKPTLQYSFKQRLITATEFEESALQIEQAQVTGNKEAICKYFIRGRCKRGLRCAFAHQ